MIFLKRYILFSKTFVMAHDFLRAGVENSQWDDNIKQNTLKILDEAKEIKSSLQNEQAQKEYEEIRLATIGALSDLRANTHEELEAVRASLWDGTIDVFSYPEWSISQEEFSNISREFSDLKSLEEKPKWIQDKEINELNENELKSLLLLSQQEYDSFTDWGTVAKWWNTLLSLAESDTYNNVSWKKELHEFQERIINKLYGEDIKNKWFTDNAIHGFGTERWWNFVISVENMEQELQNNPPEKWNSLAVVNYFSFLQSKWKFSLSTLIEVMWAENLSKLGKLWSQKDKSHPAKKKLSEIQSMRWVVEGINKETMSGVIQSSGEFKIACQILNHLPKKDRDQVIQNLVNSIYADPELITQTKKAKISTHSGVYEEVLMQVRKKIINEKLISQLTEVYQWCPEVIDKLSSIIETLYEGGWDTFDFSEINRTIAHYNRTEDTNYPIMAGNFLQDFTSTIKNLLNPNNLALSYATVDTTLSTNQENIANIEKEIKDLNSEIIRVKNEMQQAQDEIEKGKIREILQELLTNKQELQRKREYLQNYLGDENEATTAMQKIQEKLGKYKDLLSSISPSTSFELDMSKEVYKKYILANPKERLSSITSPENVMKVLRDIAPEKYDIDNLLPSLLKNETVLTFLCEKKFSLTTYFKLPRLVYNNYDALKTIVHHRPESDWKWLFYGVQRSLGAHTWFLRIKWIIEQNPDIFTPEKKAVYSKAVPATMKKYDYNNFLQGDTEEPNKEAAFESMEQFQSTVTSFLNGAFNTWPWASERDFIIQKIQVYISSENIADETIESIAQAWKLSNYAFVWLLSQLTPTNKEHVSIILNNYKTNPWVLYILPDAFYDRGDIMQEIGKGWLKNLFRSIDTITSAKRLANFLIGYKEENGRDNERYLEALVLDNIFKDQIFWEDNNIKFSEGNQLLDYYERKALEDLEKAQSIVNTSEEERIKISEQAQKYRDTIQSINENEEKRISDLLAKVGLEDESIAHLVNILKENDFNVFWSNLQTALRKLWKTSSEIQQIVWEIFTIQAESATKISDAADTYASQSPVPSTDRDVLEKRWFLREDGSIDLPKIHQQFLQRLSSIEDLKSLDHVLEDEYLEEFLQDLWFPLENIDSYQGIKESIRNKFTAEIAERIKTTYQALSPDEAANALTQGIGDYTEKKILQEIASENFSYSFESGSKKTQQSSPSQNTSPETPSPQIMQKVKQGENGTYILPTDAGDIPVSKTDLARINDNPEAEANLIDFYTTLTKLNLEEFWSYKDIIFQTIQNTSATSGVNLNDKGYVDKSDMSIFLYTIADSISESDELTENEKQDIDNMRGQKQDFDLVYAMIERVNKQTGMTQSEDESILRNEGRMWRLFREMYFSKSDDKNTQSLLFQREKFEQNLNH